MRVSMRSPHCRLRPSQQFASWCPHYAKIIKTPLRSAEKRIDGQPRYRAKRGRFRLKASNTSLAGAVLTGAQFLNCAQLVVTRNWQSGFRDETLGCGASIPD